MTSLGERAEESTNTFLPPVPTTIDHNDFGGETNRASESGTIAESLQTEIFSDGQWDIVSESSFCQRIVNYFQTDTIDMEDVLDSYRSGPKCPLASLL